MGKIKSLFFLFVFLGLVGCSATAPYVDLRHPVYLVTDKSFFAECEKYSDGPAACKEKRIHEVRRGVNGWYRHFAEPTRPKVFIVASENEIPPDAFNEPIYLRIDKDRCKEGGASDPAACFIFGHNILSSIVFESPRFISPFIAAHEFGHALGRDDNDVPVGIGSVMSYAIPTYVLPIDLEKMCALHAECPPHDQVWCEDSFYDILRCPSSSFEEGDAMRRAREEKNY